MQAYMSKPLQSFMGPWDTIFILSPAIKLTSLSTNTDKCVGMRYKVYAMHSYKGSLFRTETQFLLF